MTPVFQLSVLRVSRSTPLCRSLFAVRSLPYSERARTSPPTPTRQTKRVEMEGRTVAIPHSLRGSRVSVPGPLTYTADRFPSRYPTNQPPAFANGRSLRFPLAPDSGTGETPNKGLLSGFCIATPRGRGSSLPSHLSGFLRRLNRSPTSLLSSALRVPPRLTFVAARVPAACCCLWRGLPSSRRRDAGRTCGSRGGVCRAACENSKAQVGRLWKLTHPVKRNGCS